MDTTLQYDAINIDKEAIQAKLNNTLITTIVEAKYDDKNLHSIIDALLVDGANINTKDSNGDTPLLLALQKGFSGIAQKLIQKQADVNISNQNGDTPLIWAIVHRLPEIARIIILKDTDIEKTNRTGDSALILAAGNDLTSIVDMLLNQGADIDAANMQNITAIDAAFNEEYFDTVYYFLSKMPAEGIQGFSMISEKHSKVFNDFKIELEINIEKICKVLMPSILANYDSNFSMFKGFPEIIDHILKQQILSSADMFSEWYVLSRLEKDIIHFTNIKNKQIYDEQRRPTLVFTKTKTEVICDTLLQLKNECISNLYDATRGIASLLNPIKKPAMN